MIGQKNLLNKLSQYNIDTFPRSILLCGEEGSGKHTISKYISENIIKFNLLDITSNISDEYIDMIYRNPNPAVYLIDLTKITEKEQNVLLKFVEEPLNNSFIILLTESKNNVLNTILNRCMLFEMDNYTKDELREFITNKENEDLILSLIRTPGKIINNDLSGLNALCELVDKIVEKLSNANYANTLTIADKINYKDEYNKFDINILFDTLAYKLNKAYINTNNKNIFNMYLLTINERKKLLDKRLNKNLFMQNYLSKLWKTSRGL